MTDEVTEAYKAKLQNLARGLDTVLNAPAMDRKIGFALLIYEHGIIKAGRINYVSNSEREDIITALKEVIAQFESRRFDPPEMTQ